MYDWGNFKSRSRRVVVEEAGTIELGNMFSDLRVGDKLPKDQEYQLVPSGNRHFGVVPFLTVKSWSGHCLVGLLRYSAFSPDVCVRERLVEVVLTRGKKSRGNWGIRCPGAGSKCGRRPRKLLVHPITGALGCRACLKLKYRSSLRR